MTKITSKSITLSLDKVKALILFNIDYTILSPQAGDQIRIYYAYFNFEENDWSEYSLIKSPSSYTVISPKASISLKDIFSFKDDIKVNFGGRFRFKLSVFRNNVEIDSIVHKFGDNEFIDTSNKYSGPRIVNINFTPGVYSITWDWAYDYTKFYEFGIDHFEIIVKNIDTKISEIYYQPPHYGQEFFTFWNELKPSLVNFYIRAVDVAGRKSPSILLNKKPFKIPLVNITDRPLFDTSSFWNKLNDLLKNIPEESLPHKDDGIPRLFVSLSNAALRWNYYLQFSEYAYIKINEAIFNDNCSNNKFRGIKLESVTWDALEGEAASCGPLDCVKLDRHKYNTINFQLNLSKYFLSFSYEQMLDILTHELGHALGIGVYWSYSEDDSDGFNSGTDTIFPNSLNGQKLIYPQLQKAYNNYISKTRKYVPILFDEWSPLFGSIGANQHWSHLLNPKNQFTRQHPPTPNDILSYGSTIGIKGKITPISLKYLADIGYQEISPGASDLDLTQSLTLTPEPTLSTLSSETPAIVCGPVSVNANIVADFSKSSDLKVYNQFRTDRTIKTYDYIFTNTTTNETFIVLNVTLQGNSLAHPNNIRSDGGLNNVDDYVNFNGSLSVACAIADSRTYTNWESNSTKFSKSTVEALSSENNWKVYNQNMHNFYISPGCQS